MSGKLSHPYDYYWKKYSEGKCPFCNSDMLNTSENLDIIFCQAYGGYLSIYADASYALGDGECKNCEVADPLEEGRTWNPKDVEKTSPYRELVKDEMFLCEDCHHGVIFTASPQMIKELFLHPNDKEICKHCEWHEKRVKKQSVKEEYKPADISKYL